MAEVSLDTYFTNERADVLALIPEGHYARVLEIGGGDFPTLRRLGSRLEAEIWGVDIRDTETPGIKFVLGSIEDDAVAAQLPEKAFDLIIANDVIEHLVDTEGFLVRLEKKLAPGGLIALSVPNVRQIRTLYHIFLRGSFPRQSAGLFDRTHLRWFCKRDVVALASSAGLKTITARSVGRAVPEVLSRSLFGELLGLQNIFLMKRISDE